jgi:hypothetical protein
LSTRDTGPPPLEGHLGAARACADASPLGRQVRVGSLTTIA